MNWHSLLIWPNNPPLSLLVLFLLSTVVLYAARRQMHGVVHALCHLAASSLRVAARGLFLSAGNLRERNRTVLLAQGKSEAAEHIEREFERIAKIVRKDLQEYPALQRKLMEEVTRIEDDYQRCGEVPPPPPEWVQALEAVSQIKSGGDIPRKLLEDVHKSVQKIHDKTVAEFRRSYEDR